MKKLIIDKILLLPYYFILKFRHFLYDHSILKSREYPIPIISVGNITVGGTGKTPYVEYLVRSLSDKERVAVLSRGYGRKTKGWREVAIDDTALQVGDEPLQIKRKFPQIIVCVDEKRRRGVETLLNYPEEKRPTLIILDDAFQHRRIKPSKNIVLIDSSRPIDEDYLLPIGRLRDLPEQLIRADLVVVTKCPPEMDSADMFLWEQKIGLPAGTEVQFTTLKYSDAVPVFPVADKRYLYSKYAILLTAIANPSHLRYYLLSFYKIASTLEFRDHHNFTGRDAKKITGWANKEKKALIITTEKDAQRLSALTSLPDEIKSRMFYLPIEAVHLERGQQ
ncbi:MAG: tetraacyldisaccharide 4'-kinase [Bacteroidales bacterium]|nr:tetraacyldisaccharide 4'-kinase [Bacteroidales bacterium]MDD4057853.1 tetraacyldisaccharide 4'-kinase [Bacteroidales bacterium]